MTIVYFSFRVAHQLLHPQGGDGVQRRAGLVHEDHLRGHRHHPGDAQPLLLSQGQGKRVLAQRILHLVPQIGRAQAFLHHVGKGAPPMGPQHPRAERHVVEDALRKGVGPLEDHAHPLAQLHHVGARARRCPSRRCSTLPSRAAPGMVSFMRLRQRRKVDFPHPEGRSAR